MTDRAKKAAREKRRNAYRDFMRGLTSLSGIYAPSASSIFDCLKRADLQQQHAMISQLSRDELFREDPQANAPEELSDQAISAYLAAAGGLYGAAATDCLLIVDLRRAFKYFRKAAHDYRRAVALLGPCDCGLSRSAREYQERAAIVRQELARRTLRRKRLSLGLWKRSR
jgi:hypothetical protein